MTGYGFTGPMTARGTVFDAKAGAAAAGTGNMLLLGVGCWLLFFLLF